MDIQKLIEAVDFVKTINSSNEANPNPKPSSMYERWVGEYVIARTKNEGVLFGKITACDPTGFEIKGARRLHYHVPKDKSLSWFEGVAKSGLSDNSRVSCEGDKLVIEAYSFVKCTKEAIESMSNFTTYAQS